MTRTEHLEFCSICIHQQDDLGKGSIICGLSGQIADFEDECNSFVEDLEVIEQLKFKEIEDKVIDKMANQGKRFLNYLLDTIFTTLLIYVFIFIFMVALAIVSPSAISDIRDNNMLFVYLMGGIITMIYYIIFEAATGRSIAKYITKTKVVNEIGEKPTFKIILVRSLCRFIPFEAIRFVPQINHRLD